ncbi:APC family permease [Haloarchaeobius sp. DYHT-AS-18]|uniref:APC family permease n=1 Tax=Haloarchaeobius sp. DYHT-AS-18 TaxID=3446117 RepID=UPI003EB9CFBB
MSEESLGFTGATAIGLGGMIGGGVFAVLGVVASIAGAAAWLAFLAASLVSMCAAYAYLKLNRINDRNGGSVTQLETYLDDTDYAGMVGWTLLLGYVGSIAMYAYAFGGFGVKLLPSLGLGESVLHPLLSVLAVAFFVGLNVLGARATGSSEKVLVTLKVVILLGIGLWGLYYGSTKNALQFGFSNVATTGFVTAVAVSFVSFQGWQLLLYDQERIENVEKNLPRAVSVSIVGAILVDCIVAVLVTSLVKTSVIQAHPEIAVARAVEPFLGQLGFTFVAVAALFSTGSAINGTLFSAAHFTKGMLDDGLAPDQLGDADASGAPTRTVLVLGAAAAAFAAYGSLNAITSFGSLAFVVVFGTVCALALTERDHEEMNPLPPAAGFLGCLAAFPLILYHLWVAERGTFVTVVVLAVAVVSIEVLYFKRETLLAEADAVADRVESAVEN